MDRSSLLGRVVTQLAGPDPVSGLARTIETLREFGIVVGQIDGPSEDPSHTAVSGQAPSWVASPPLSPGEAESVRAVLELALGRVRERHAHRRTRERLDMLSSASFEGILIHEDGVVVDGNQRLSELLGYGLDELLGPDTLPRCVASEDLPTVLEYMRTRHEGVYTITGVRKDGSRFRAELQAKQGALGDRPVRVAAVRDVTERERRDKLIEESEHSFRELARAMFDIIVSSRDGQIVEVRGDTLGLLGYPPEEIIGRPIVDFATELDRRMVRQVLEHQRLERYRTTIEHRDGTQIPVEVTPIQATLHGSPVRFAGLRDLRGQLREQAERIALEQRMAQSQRIESLGLLAGGVAHDFNNLLLGLLGHAELLAKQVSDPEQLEAVAAIRTAGERAATLTAQMLAYAGRQDLGERQRLDVSELISELRDLLTGALSKHARLKLALEPECFIFGDRATLTQVIMNLLTNAADALGDHQGTIDVRTRRLPDLPEQWRGAVQHAAGTDYVEISVSDDGKGMTSGTMARVFEPFFTTKGGQGHGLGLAAAHGIVRAHGGAIRVDSTLGKGSCFSLVVPRVPTERKAAPKAANPTPTRQRKVLVIDDEPLVRAFLVRALTHAGYAVDEAKDGAGALDILTRTAPDLVLLDMSLPDLDGAEILRRIRESGHTMPVLLASGYLADEIESALRPGSFQGFLQKPFRMDALLRSVGETLAGAPLNAR